MGDIIFTRDYQEINNLFDYKIYVNDKEVNSIANGSRKVVSLKPGNYEVFIKCNSWTSSKLHVNVKGKETLRYSCGSKVSGFKMLFSWLFIFSKNNLYLKETI